jgi:hypothetical protein
MDLGFAWQERIRLRRNGAGAARIPSTSEVDAYRSVLSSSLSRRLQVHRPLPRFGNPRDHDEGQRGSRVPDAPQRRNIVVRFPASKHDIRIQKVFCDDVLRLLRDLMAIRRKGAGKLACIHLFKANNDYLCHDTALPWNPPLRREARGKSGPDSPRHD